MALIVLGVATRAHVRSLRAVAEGDRLESTWLKVQELFFSGADDQDMLDVLATVDQQVRHQHVVGSMRQVLTFTLDRLAQDDVVLLAMDSTTTYGGHWVLAVGVEQAMAGARRTTTGVLCLDSVEPAPQLAPFNTRLDLNSPNRGARQLYYRRPCGGLHLVTCRSAIALSRRS